jgi:hypothetical protein
MQNVIDAHSTPSPSPVASARSEASRREGSHAFDFQTGTWRIRNLRLRERLHGCKDWEEFAATCIARPLPGGIGNQDEFHTDHWPGFVGMTFRFYNPETEIWSLYWASNVRGILEPPVVGSFAGEVGIFEGDDLDDGRPVRVRFVWSGVASRTPRWEQAFSVDGGRTWETNWIMEFTRDDAQ